MSDKPASTDEPKSSPLTYEETPIIDPHSGEVKEEHVEIPEERRENVSSVIPEAARVFQSTGEEAQTPSPSQLGTLAGEIHPPKKRQIHLGTVLFVLLLFGLGIWLSTQLRSFLSPVSPSEEVVVPTLAPFNYPTSEPRRAATGSGIQAEGVWQTYDIISGVTKKPVTSVSYELPREVKAPVCDSASCASQGTYLPGGTRFTVAARGKGQLLPDFRGAILTDAAGRDFTMKQAVIGSAYVYEYTGNFSGRTSGGYTFTNIRGVLVPVSETLAIEFNHFAPAGITTDFAKDDALFDQIIQSFSSSGYTLPTPTSKPTTAPVVTSSPTSATSSGY